MMLRLRFIFSVLLLFVIMASCGDNQHKKDGNSELFIAASGLRKVGLPHQFESKFDFVVGQQVYETLYRFNIDSMALFSTIIESSEVKSNSKNFILTVKKNIYFSDKSEVTSTEILSSIENGINNIDNVNSKKLRELVASMKVLDRHRLSIELHTSYPNFLELLTHPSISVFHPISKLGTGPYKIDKNSRYEIILSKNENYHQKSVGNIYKIRFYKVKNQINEIEEFRKGKSFLILDFEEENIDRVLTSLEDAQQGKVVKHLFYSKEIFEFLYLIYFFEDEPKRKLIKQIFDAHISGGENVNIVDIKRGIQTYNISSVNYKISMNVSKDDIILFNGFLDKISKKYDIKFERVYRRELADIYFDNWKQGLQNEVLSKSILLDLYSDFLTQEEKDYLKKNIEKASYRQRSEELNLIITSFKDRGYFSVFHRKELIYMYSSKLKDFNVKFVNYIDFANMKLIL